MRWIRTRPSVPSHVGTDIVWESSVSSSSPDVTFNDANGSPITIWLTRTQDFTIRCAYPDTAEVNIDANIDVAALGAAGTVEGTGAAWDSEFNLDLIISRISSTINHGEPRLNHVVHFRTTWLNRG